MLKGLEISEVHRLLPSCWLWQNRSVLARKKGIPGYSRAYPLGYIEIRSIGLRARGGPGGEKDAYHGSFLWLQPPVDDPAGRLPSPPIARPVLVLAVSYRAKSQGRTGRALT